MAIAHGNNNMEAERRSTFFIYLPSQKKWLLQAFLFSVAGFILLKLCFPVPDFDLDSTNYVSWALNNLKVAYRPLGYPHFLQILHDNVSGSLSFLIVIQYVLYFLSMLFAFFTIDFFSVFPEG